MGQSVSRSQRVYLLFAFSKTAENPPALLAMYNYLEEAKTDATLHASVGVFAAFELWECEPAYGGVRPLRQIYI